MTFSTDAAIPSGQVVYNNYGQKVLLLYFLSISCHMRERKERSTKWLSKEVERRGVEEGGGG